MPEFTGTPADDTLDGSSGDDLIVGLGGADTLNGGDGNDVIYGGDGASSVGEVTRISVTSTGGQATGGPSWAGYVSPDGNTVVFWSQADNLGVTTTGNYWGLFSLDRTTGEVSSLGVSIINPRAVDFSPDGARIAYVGQNGRAFVMDLATGVSTAASDRHVDNAPVFSEDGSSILALADYVRGDDDFNSRHIVEFGSSGASIWRQYIGDEAMEVAFSADRAHYAVVRRPWDEPVAHYGLQVFDRELGTSRYIVQTSEAVGRIQVAFSPDGNTLAYSSDDGVTIYNVVTQTSYQLLHPTNDVPDYGSVQFTPDGGAVLVEASGLIWLVGLDGAVTVLGEGSSPAVGEDGVSVTFVSSDATLVEGDTNGLADTYLLTLPGAPGDADTLNGGAGNDTLDGGLGADIMTGGIGNDSYHVDNAGDVVIEAASGGTDTIYSATSYTLPGHVEVLQLTGTLGVNATGNTGADVLIGNDGNNTLDGMAGADTMRGALGDDTYHVREAGDQVIEFSGEGKDTVLSWINYTLGQFLEILVLVGTANINGTGNTTANTIRGNSGDNILDGGLGSDVLQGGAGDDTYVVNSSSDQVIELANEGTDTVRATAGAHTLSENVENLVLTGTATNGTGNALSNTLTGNDGKNVLNGMAGADTMIGGKGDDTYYVDNAGDVIVEANGEGYDRVYASVSYTLAVGSYVQGLILTGTSALNGTGNGAGNDITGNTAANTLDGRAANDVLDGGRGNDILLGGDGNDTLIGGLDADEMAGGKGNDTFYIEDIRDTLIEFKNEGYDTAHSSVSFTLEVGVYVEALLLTGMANINGTGNGIDNVIRGNNADNILDGGKGDDVLQGAGGNDTLNGGVSGADQMYGGLGDDTYYVNSGGDLAREDPGEGTDWVYSSVSYNLNDQYIERLTLTGSADIYAKGNSLDNRLVGNSGDNRINGMGGQDRLTGGAGSDTFIWDKTSHSKVSDSDRIVDLSNEDFIDLSRIDANVTVGGTQHFVLVDAFTNTAGQVVLTYDAGTNVTSLNADTNGDGVSDMLVRIDGDHEDFTNFIFGGG